VVIGPVSGIASAAVRVAAPALPSLPSVSTPAPGTGATERAGFGEAVIGALEDLSSKHHAVDGLATKAATGQLPDVHDYVIAATEASLATELTVAVRNKAVEAFTSIMQMPL
jgi:flagellar hook-basal body complex protein FliE